MRWIAERFMKLLGWRVVGSDPLPDKFVAIGAPHTSNWDFMLFLAAVSHFRIKAKVIGKHTLAQGPFSWFFRRMGVIPADRSTPGGLVEQMKAEFGGAESLALVIAPEGTRSKTDRWRSGFYHIALAADVPVICGYVDFGAKRVGFGDRVDLTGDVSADMDRVRSFYARVGVGRYPEKQGTIRLREED